MYEMMVAKQSPAISIHTARSVLAEIGSPTLTIGDVHRVISDACLEIRIWNGAARAPYWRKKALAYTAPTAVRRINRYAEEEEEGEDETESDSDRPLTPAQLALAKPGARIHIKKCVRKPVWRAESPPPAEDECMAITPAPAEDVLCLLGAADATSAHASLQTQPCSVPLPATLVLSPPPPIPQPTPVALATSSPVADAPEQPSPVPSPTVADAPEQEVPVATPLLDAPEQPSPVPSPLADAPEQPTTHPGDVPESSAPVQPPDMQGPFIILVHNGVPTLMQCVPVDPAPFLAFAVAQRHHHGATTLARTPSPPVPPPIDLDDESPASPAREREASPPPKDRERDRASPSPPASPPASSFTPPGAPASPEDQPATPLLEENKGQERALFDPQDVDSAMDREELWEHVHRMTHSIRLSFASSSSSSTPLANVRKLIDHYNGVWRYLDRALITDWRDITHGLLLARLERVWYERPIIGGAHETVRYVLSVVLEYHITAKHVEQVCNDGSGPMVGLAIIGSDMSTRDAFVTALTLHMDTNSSAYREERDHIGGALLRAWLFRKRAWQRERQRKRELKRERH